MANPTQNFIEGTDSGLLAIANSTSRLWTKVTGRDKNDLANLCMIASPFLDAAGLILLKPRNPSLTSLVLSLDFAYSVYMFSASKSDFDINSDKISSPQDFSATRLYGAALLFGALINYSHSFASEAIGSAILGTGLMCKAAHAYILRSGD
jgi:hypothetical protein